MELTTPAPKLNARAGGMLDRYRERARAFLVAQPERRTAARKFHRVLSEEGDFKRASAPPGVRPAGSALDDQARAATPQSALQAGATHLVIGRPITAAADPRAAALAVAESIALI